MTPREFAAYTMARHHFKREAADLVLSTSEFELWNPNSIAGGGEVRWKTIDTPTTVIFKTSQAEAAVHELAHAWLMEFHLVNTADSDHLYRDVLVPGFLRLLEDDDYPQLQANAKEWEQLFWLGEPYNRWDEQELYASLASSVMGNINMLPDYLRPAFKYMLDEPLMTYLPVVRS